MKVEIDYTNWNGERRKRIILPQSIHFGSNEWHTEPQWLLHAIDEEKGQVRAFAIKDIHSWSKESGK